MEYIAYIQCWTDKCGYGRWGKIVQEMSGDDNNTQKNTIMSEAKWSFRNIESIYS